MNIETRPTTPTEHARFARCLEASRQVRWDIDRDVIRGRTLDFSRPFLPDGLSLLGTCDFLDADDRRLISQIQGRTYANMFGLVERYINAKVVEAQQQYLMGDQVALEAMVRFSDEEIKHQKLFRRVDEMIASGMPEGYTFDANPDAVADAVLSHSSWSVLGLTLVIELFTQAHYRESIDPQSEICPLFKDIFLYHWREESQHAILDEIEWRREDARLSAEARRRAVDDLISLVGAVDRILQQQARADARYFFACTRGAHGPMARARVDVLFLEAYRWQYIFSGTSLARFRKTLTSMIDADCAQQIEQALASLSPSAGEPAH